MAQVLGKTLGYALLLCCCTGAREVKALEQHQEYNSAWQHWLAKDQDAAKILNGGVVAPGSRAWQVGILRADISDNFYGLFCSGMVVKPGWVVTAAHCVSGLNKADINVLLDTTKLDGSGLRLGIASVLIHPKYDPESIVADIALLRLKDESQGVRVEVAERAVDNAMLRTGLKVTVSGWGLTDVSLNRKSATLLAAELPFQTNVVCNGPESYNGFVKDSMFCAGYLQGGTDACTYDSGGPAVAFHKGRIILFGIVSFGEDCGKPKKFSVFTRISRYKKWILTYALP
jgi:secreted trypsin-like serine protease